MTLPPPSPLDPDVEFALERSETPRAVDGYKRGEPKRLRCLHCHESIPLTEVPSAGIFSFPHIVDCPVRETTDGARDRGR